MCSMHLLPGTWNLSHDAHRTSSAHITGDELHLPLPVLFKTSAIQFSKSEIAFITDNPSTAWKHDLELAGSRMGDHLKCRNEGIKSKAPGKYFAIFATLRRKMLAHRKEGPEGQTTVPSEVHDASNASLTDESCPHPKKWHQQDGSKNVIYKKKNPSDFSLASYYKWHAKWLLPLICCCPSPNRWWLL